MPPNALKIAAYCAYLLSWLVFAIAAVVNAIPRLKRQAGAPMRVSAPVLIGTLLQAAAAFALSRTLPSGPLHSEVWELIAALLLAPLGAALFVWAVRSVPRDAGAETLVTGGAYARLRHPIYLAFFCLLLATGLILSNGIKLILPVVLFLAGSELRIAAEEEDLSEKFSGSYTQYRQRTRWRYLPGLR